MFVDAVRKLSHVLAKAAQPHENLGRSAEQVENYRSYVHGRVLSHVSARVGLEARLFEGLAWDYFLSDVQMEARAARIGMRAPTVGSICDTIQAFPPAAIVRLMAAIFVYFTPRTPKNENQVDYLLEPLDANTIKLMRQRRHAVHAVQATDAKQDAAKQASHANEARLKEQWYNCPNTKISSEPINFLRWIKLQTPDTWHIIVEGWNYNDGDRDDVIDWILHQRDCDLGTAAQFFFTCGLAGEDPEALSPLYCRNWHLMKCVADNWQRGFYTRNELQPSIEPSDIRHYDELVARRAAEGRPLSWKIPGPEARRFGSRLPESAFYYVHGHLRMTLAAWKRHRERSGCGKDFPRCCEA